MQEDNTQTREYIRLITGIPIEVHVEYNQNYQMSEDIVTNISFGGLSFIATDRLGIDKSTQVRFPVLGREIVVTGKVVWCEKTNRGYQVGLKFDDPNEIERLKIIEQTFEIERYRGEIEQQEGRELSSLQAAREWSSKYAGDFSSLS